MLWKVAAQTTEAPPAVRPVAAWINTLAGDSPVGNVGVLGGIGYYCRQWTATDVSGLSETTTSVATLRSGVCTLWKRTRSTATGPPS